MDEKAGPDREAGRASTNATDGGGGGKVTLEIGLSEYTSRKCRLRLVEVTARAIERHLAEKGDRGVSGYDPRTGAARILAGILKVSTRTVQRWLSGGIQSCNVNAERLIQVALRYDEYRTVEIIEEDLENHRFYAEYVLNGRYGAVGVLDNGTVMAKPRQGGVAQ